MSLVALENASLAHGTRKLLDRVSLTFAEAEHTGLIGPNGSGKSTLLRILAGLQGLDDGRVVRARTTRLGYLPQDVETLPGDSVLESVLAAVPGRADVEARLSEAERELAAATAPDAQMGLAAVVAERHEELDYFETFYSERRARHILVGLGFAESDLARPCRELSGGWRMRVALAGLLFQAPDLLLLDEPTNHLDAPSVAWLDRFLGDYRKSIVLICHDRTFLDRHVERIVSFEPEGVRTYPGDYEDYLEQRALEEEVLESRARHQERELRDLQRFVDKFRAKATKARQAQSRAKQIARIEKTLVKPIVRPRRLRFTFPEAPRTGRDALRLEGVSKRFGERPLFRDLTLHVQAGDRIALLGVNGAGKTTLLRIMAGELAPDAGRVVPGASVITGYYAQHHTEVLDPRRTVLEEVWRVTPSLSQTHVRGVCGAFLFSGDDVDKPVGVLSGGERARVLLARLLVQPANLLLLDEPTNHLDLAAAETLADALEGYGGTLVFASHNTSFTNRLATKVWDVEGGRVLEYPGNLETYLDHLERRRRAEAEEAARREAAATAPRSAAAATARTTAPRTAATPAPAAPPPATAESPPATGTTGTSAPEDAAPSRRRRRRRKRSAAAGAAPSVAAPPPAASGPHGAERGPRRTDEERRGATRGGPARQELAGRIAALRETEAALALQLAAPEIYADGERFNALLAEHRQAQRKREELEARL